MNRRGFFSWCLALGSLGASYGLAGFYALRFLFPSHKRPRRRQVFVGLRHHIPVQGLRFTLPSGQEVLVRATGTDYNALSNVCPHLGCKVRWEPQNQRFLCPCHNGTFAPDGRATSGPPKAEGKNLTRYDMVARGDALYLEYLETT